MNRLLSHWTAIVPFLLFLLSCGDDDDTQRSPAMYRFVNAVVDSPPLDLYVADTLRNDSRLPIGFNSFTRYMSIAPGNIKFSVTANNHATELFSKVFNLSSGKFYTAAFVNTLSSMEGIIIEDNLTVADSTKSYLRIINLSPNAGPIDFRSNNGTPIGIGINYKEASPFVAISPGTSSYTISGQGINLAVNNLNAPIRKHVSIILVGLKNATGVQSLKFNIMLN